MNIATRFVVLRAQVVNRRAARRRRRQLERELAGYCTPAQVVDLEATLDRYPDRTTWEIRSILARPSCARDPRSQQLPGIGRQTR